MLKDITIGQYYPVDSPVHRLDPRVKILGMIIYMASLFFVKDFYVFSLTFLFMLSVVKLARVPLKLIVKGLKPIVIILLFTLVLNVFFTPGEVLWSFGFLKVTKEGLKNAVFLGTRLILLVTGSSLLTLTTSPVVLTDGIERLLKPFRVIGVPAHEIAMMMSIALRYIPTLIEETDKIMKAQMARGASFDTGNLLQRAKALLPLLVPLFINSFKRGEELAYAMEARAYRGGENRTTLKELKYKKEDFLAYFLVLSLLAVILVTRRVNFLDLLRTI